MPFQILDLILVGIMLISGVLALLRGFTREVLSVLAWGAAGLAAYFAVMQPGAVAFAQKYVEKELLAQIAVAAVAFVVVLIIVSIISVKISDAVVDSSAGAVDRTLGFLFGLGRGLVLVAVAYQFYSALTPKQDDWIKNAQSLPLIQGTANALVAMLPPNVLERITNLSRPVDENQPGDGTAQPTDQPGVSSGDSNSLGNLSNDATTPAQAPAQ